MSRDMSRSNQFSGQQAVHIGTGNFALSHIIPFYDKIGLDVQGISLRRGDTKKLLQDSDFDYTLAARDSLDFFEAEKVTALKSITNVPMKESNAPDDVIDAQRRQAIALIGDPKTAIVSMTVTINGYGFREAPTKREIDWETNSVVNKSRDATDPEAEKVPLSSKDSETTVAYITAGLNERMRNGAGPIVVMSLDNMPLNGTHLFRAVKEFALEHYGQELFEWMRSNTFFPDTMVDRIAPTRDEKMIDEFVEGTGIENTRESVVVITEKLPERSLVISLPEQAEIEVGQPLNPVFINHPVIQALTQLPGVEQSPYANLYSERKVHVFNGAHFGLAMVGRLANKEYAHEALNNPAIAGFTERLLRELSSGVDPLLADQNGAYIQEFIDRVSNPHMKDELFRIGRNGSGKIFERVLIPWYLATTDKTSVKGLSHQAIDEVGAAWIRFVERGAQAKSSGEVFDINDSSGEEAGLLDLDPEMFSNAQGVLAKIGLMENTPGSEAFASDLNASRSGLDRLLVEAERGYLPEAPELGPNRAVLSQLGIQITPVTIQPRAIDLTGS